MECSMTKEAFVCVAIVRAFGGPAPRRRRRHNPVRSGDELRGVSENIIAIHAHDHVVQLVTRETRGARPRFKMQHQCGIRHEALAAICAGADDVLRFVQGGVEMRVEVALAPEDALAGGAVPVFLKVVLVKRRRRPEYLFPK